MVSYNEYAVEMNYPEFTYSMKAKITSAQCNCANSFPHSYESSRLCANTKKRGTIIQLAKGTL